MSDKAKHIEGSSKSGEQDDQRMRSEVTELIDSKPGFLIRWGVTLLFLAFLLILSAAWFIRYPDATGNQRRLFELIFPLKEEAGFKRQGH